MTETLKHNSTFTFHDITNIPAITLNASNSNLLTSDNISQLLARAVYAAAEDINPLKRREHDKSTLLDSKFKTLRSPSSVTMYIQQSLQDDDQVSEEINNPSIPLFGMNDFADTLEVNTDSKFNHQQEVFEQKQNEITSDSNSGYEINDCDTALPSFPMSHDSSLPSPRFNNTYFDLSPEFTPCRAGTEAHKPSLVSCDLVNNPFGIDINAPLEQVLPLVHQTIEKLECEFRERAMRPASPSSFYPSETPIVCEPDPTPHLLPSCSSSPLSLPSPLPESQPILPLSTLTLPVPSPHDSVLESFDELKLLQQQPRDTYPSFSKWYRRPNTDHIQADKRAPMEYWVGSTFEVPCRRWDPLRSSGIESSFSLTCSPDCGIWSIQFANRLNVHHSDLLVAMHAVAIKANADHRKFEQMFPKHLGSGDRWIMADRLIHLFHHMPTYIHMINRPSELGHQLCSVLRTQAISYPCLQVALLSCQSEHDLLMARSIVKSAVASDLIGIKDDMDNIRKNMENLRRKQTIQQKQLESLTTQLACIAKSQQKLEHTVEVHGRKHARSRQKHKQLETCVAVLSTLPSTAKRKPSTSTKSQLKANKSKPKLQTQRQTISIPKKNGEFKSKKRKLI